MIEQFGDAVDDLTAAVERPSSTPQELQMCVQQVWQAAHAARADALDQAQRRLVPLLAVPHAGCAAYVALCCGGLVEQGADPTVALPALLDRLAIVLAD